MKILHFYKTFSMDAKGGTQMAIKQLCYSSEKLGISNTILSLSPDPNDMIQTENFRSFQVKEDFSIASNSISFSVIKKFKALAETVDIIHCYFPWPFMDLVYLLSGVKKPLLITYESDIVRQKLLMKIYEPLMHHFFKKAHHVVATSPNYVRTSTVLQRYKNKVSVIPIGLDKEIYPIPDEMRLKKWQLKFNKPFFLFVGVIRYYKGLHILLEAAKNVNFPIVIVGTGPIEQKLKYMAEQLSLTNVCFLGAISEVDKVALLKLCYGFVFPSHLRSEAFGISLLEAAMYGKPMISCEIGTGTSYINTDQQTGVVIPPNDVSALQKAMQTLYDHPGMAQKMGENAKKKYYELFTAEKMATAYKNVYERLIT